MKDLIYDNTKRKAVAVVIALAMVFTIIGPLNAQATDTGGISLAKTSIAVSETTTALASTLTYTSTSGAAIGTTSSAITGTTLAAILATTGSSIVWDSSDSSVATVLPVSTGAAISTSTSAAITGVAAGTATITATVYDISSNAIYEGTATITVASPPPTPKPVDSIAVSPVTASLVVGATQQLTHTVLPTDADNASVSYTSSAETIATVSPTGLVTAVSAGSATITVKSVENSAITATATITVTAAPTPVTPTPVVETTGVTLTPATKSLVAGSTVKLKAVVAPADATDPTVTYESSAKGVATVSATGLVKAIKAGKATITVKTVNGKTDTSVITVTDKEVAAPKQTAAVKKSFTKAVAADKKVVAKLKNNTKVGKKVTFKLPKASKIKGYKVTYTWKIGNKVVSSKSSYKIAKKYKGKTLKLTVTYTTTKKAPAGKKYKPSSAKTYSLGKIKK